MSDPVDLPKFTKGEAYKESVRALKKIVNRQRKENRRLFGHDKYRGEKAKTRRSSRRKTSGTRGRQLDREAGAQDLPNDET